MHLEEGLHALNMYVGNKKPAMHVKLMKNVDFRFKEHV